ncbi:butyrophilin subfamily 1 member A1-like [Platysternon megacephalum]|uniref:Butyrophilin subfamily 1 member A1-like n=1 Tax=Platysternon megacephalum TaxID=55544 RepID=A0A4D9DK81_9SAUR|nr:butyrophilin subfamily 1 member A1-like [Platysternon megacephalum]
MWKISVTQLKSFGLIYLCLAVENNSPSSSSFGSYWQGLVKWLLVACCRSYGLFNVICGILLDVKVQEQSDGFFVALNKHTRPKSSLQHPMHRGKGHQGGSRLITVNGWE